MKLTKRAIDELLPDNTRGRYHVWDDQLPGFGVRVSPSGEKRYVLKYRTNGGGRNAPQKWLTIGAHGVLTPDQARDEAKKLLGAVATGIDPQSDKITLREAPKMEDLWARFEGEQLGMKKTSTARDYKRCWTEEISPTLSKKLIAEISRSDIDRMHKKRKDTPYAANRMLALLSRLFSLAERWDWRAQGTNPCKHIDRFPEESRERFLKLEELTAIGSAMEQLQSEGKITGNVVAAIQLLLLTGARLNEVLTAKWEWVDFDKGIIALPDSKTGKKPLFLSAASLAILKRLLANRIDPENPFILPGRHRKKPLNNLSKPWYLILKTAGIPGVRLHDLRHTAASVAVGQGASLALIGRLLGHSQTQTTHRYAHVDIDPAIGVANAIGDAISGAIRAR